MPSVSDRNDLLGQAYGMRALAYLYAVRVWGDVPLFTEPNEEYSQEIYRERTDMDYILREVVLEDAKKAESLIDRTKNKERKRISVYGAWAIMADTYMWLKEYSLADQTIEKMKNDASFMALETDISTEEDVRRGAEQQGQRQHPRERRIQHQGVHFHRAFQHGRGGHQRLQLHVPVVHGSGNRAAVMSPTLLAKYDQEKDLRFPLVTKKLPVGLGDAQIHLGRHFVDAQ